MILTGTISVTLICWNIDIVLINDSMQDNHIETTAHRCRQDWKLTISLACGLICESTLKKKQKKYNWSFLLILARKVLNYKHI